MLQRFSHDIYTHATQKKFVKLKRNQIKYLRIVDYVKF